jgi:putative ABC transport system ATP-binding protein
VLDLPTEGVVRVAGQDVTALDDANRSQLRGNSIGFVFQQFHLIPHLTALGNVATALLYRGLTRAERRDSAMAALEQVGLGPRADHRPLQLSGGEQQRVAIARAMACAPPILLGDELTGNLDTQLAQEMLKLLKKLNDGGTTVVYVTHDQALAALASRIVSVRDGLITGDTGRRA